MGPVARVAGAYTVGVNAASAGLFGYDKWCAQNRQWRVPENVLCCSAIAGGWIGGMWAMEYFRHKTKKESFREKYFAAVGANVIGVGGLGAVAARNPALLRDPKMLQTLRSMLGFATKAAARPKRR
eukprot:jgi/Chlat1/4402/Chrsp29S04532